MILEDAGLDKNGDPIEGIDQPPKRKARKQIDESESENNKKKKKKQIDSDDDDK